jgi:hypothetical protein
MPSMQVSAPVRRAVAQAAAEASAPGEEVGLAEVDEAMEAVTASLAVAVAAGVDEAAGGAVAADEAGVVRPTANS